MQAGEGQRERETQNLKQAPGSELSTQSPMWGLNPGDHDVNRSQTFNQLSHPGAPPFVFNIYLFLRDKERQSMSGEGGEREGDTESKAGSRL